MNQNKPTKIHFSYCKKRLQKYRKISDIHKKQQNQQQLQQKTNKTAKVHPSLAHTQLLHIYLLQRII